MGETGDGDGLSASAESAASSCGRGETSRETRLKEGCSAFSLSLSESRKSRLVDESMRCIVQSSHGDCCAKGSSHAVEKE